MASKKLEVIITGKADGAVKAMHDTERGAGSLASKVSGAATKITAGFAVAGVAAAGLAVKSSNTFKNVGTEVSKLERVTGLGAKGASRLRFAFQMAGIKIDAGTRAIGAFSKKVVASKDPMKDFGFQTRDASGHILPMNDLMKRAADRLAGMKNGAEKNALAMKLFGKGGLDMVKVLGKGGEAFLKTQAEAKKYGLELTEGNVEAVKKSIKSHREQEAAMQGLQVTIGQYVLPVLTKVTKWLAEKLPEAIKFLRRKIKDLKPQFRQLSESMSKVWKSIKEGAGKVRDALKPITTWIKDFVSKHPTGVLKTFAAVIGTVLVIAFIAWATAAASAAAATLAATWPVLAVIAAIGLLVLGLKYAYDHWGWFRDAVDKVSSFVRNTVIPAIKELWGWFQDNLLPIIKKVASWLAEQFVQKLQLAREGFTKIINKIRSLWKWFRDNLLPIIQVVGAWLVDQFAKQIRRTVHTLQFMIGKLRTIWDFLGRIKDAGADAWGWASDLGLGGAIGAITGGGDDSKPKGGKSMGTAGQPRPGRSIRSGGSGGGDTINHIHVAGSVLTADGLASTVADALNRRRSQTGRSPLVGVR